MKNITLIIPAKYEKESLPEVLLELKKYSFNIVVILEPTDHETINSIKNFECKIIHQTTIGYGNALILGIKNVKTEYFCIFNADGSFEHNDLLKMYQHIKENDFIYTSRYEQPGGSDDDTIITFIGNKFFSKLGNILFSLKITDILYTYLMGKTSSHKSLNIQSNDFRYCVELPIKMQLAKMRYQYFPSYEKKRIAGKKKVNAFKDGFLILIEMLKLFFKYKVFRNKIIN